MNLNIALALLVTSGCVAGLILTPLARLLAIRIGLVDNPGERKIHQQPTPYGGGIAIFVATVGILICAYGGAYLLTDGPSLLGKIAELLRPHRDGLFAAASFYRFIAVLAGGTLMFLLGLIDDLRHLKPGTKFAVQILAALLLVISKQRITLFVDSEVLSIIFTVAWVLFVTNAFNLLDNMDGLSAGVAAITGAVFMVVALQNGQLFVAAFLAVFVGVLFGFLRYNFAPARLFMGDAGSLFVGYTLAALTIAGTYYEGHENLYAVCVPVLVMGVPFYDTLSVLWIRHRTGKPFFVGDTNHLSHRLVRLGMTRREAVLSIYILSLILGGSATLLRNLDATGTVTVLLLGLGVITLIILLENAAGRKRHQ